MREKFQGSIVPRVLVLTTSFPRFPGDEASIFVGKLIEGYNASAASGIVLVPYDEYECAREQQQRFEVIRFRYGLFSRGRLAFGKGILPNLRSNPLLFFQIPSLLCFYVLHALLRRNRFDCIHAQWAISALPAFVISRMLQRPFIVTLRGEDIRLLTLPILSYPLRLILRQANAITAVSHSSAATVQSLIGVSVRVVPNGVEPAEPTAKNEEEINDWLSQRNIEQFILFVGRVIEVKRVHLLPQLLELECFHDHHLLIVGRFEEGDSAHEKLSNALNDSPMKKRVHLFGPCSPAKVSTLMKKAAWLVSASAREGMPNAVLEGLSLKKPVLLSNIPAHAELLGIEKCGILFNVEGENIDLNHLQNSMNIFQFTPTARVRRWKEVGSEYLAILQPSAASGTDSVGS